MKVGVETLQKVLENLAQQSGETLDHAGLVRIWESIDPKRGGDYLYKKIFLELKKKKYGSTMGVSAFHFERIAKFLGYTSFSQLERKLATGTSPQLQSLIGNYYSYVRANHKEGIILRSPVRIHDKTGQIFFELQGTANLFTGEVQLRNGCLFIHMDSREGKSFHHIYKIGNRHEPALLQGIFSGVSTAFDPIGGRCVLIRQSGSFSILKNEKIKIALMLKSRSADDKRLAMYFRDFNDNNLSTLKSSSFSFDDLV